MLSQDTLKRGRLVSFEKSVTCRVLGLVAVILAGTARAASPPVRLGLWEVQTNTTMESDLPFQIPPAQAEQLKRMGIPVPGSPVKRTDQSCVNEQSFDRLGEPDRKNRACHRENVQLSSQGLGADIICDRDGANGHGRIDLVFDDTSHFHGTMEIKGHSSSAPGVNGVNITMEGHWLGAECGKAKPLGD